MCTVTYIPNKGKRGFILTSNRDEHKLRETVPPKLYKEYGVEMGYPKDKRKGGSWIAMKNGRLCCLLNGAYEKHIKENYHTRSRGDVLKKLVASDNHVKDYFDNENLNNVEPFTIVTCDITGNDITLIESVWDGKNISVKEIDSGDSHIWSSATLYDSHYRAERRRWFNKFIDKDISLISREEIFNFHSHSHTNDINHNLIMERDSGVKTVSITQVEYSGNRLSMNYSDLINNKEFTIKL
ncbi:MAG: NRDE family protein [Bacteroidales bacterium]|jgi:uncharacterized protein with NRDE domain|nr:NRDE family protein [Bacteroidales bacterium]